MRGQGREQLRKPSPSNNKLTSRGLVTFSAQIIRPLGAPTSEVLLGGRGDPTQSGLADASRALGCVHSDSSSSPHRTSGWG